MTLLCQNYTGHLIDNTDPYQRIDLVLKTFVTTRCASVVDSSIILKQVVQLYYEACKTNDEKALKLLTQYKTVMTNIPRYDILWGVCSLAHSHNLVSFRLCHHLISIFNVSIEEVDGTKFNLLQYCLSCDNIDLLHYLMKRFNFKLNEMEPLQKELLIDTIVFNTSRKCLDYLYNNKEVTTHDLDNVPSYFIDNKVFLKEITRKYNYKGKNTKINDNICKIIADIIPVDTRNLPQQEKVKKTKTDTEPYRPPQLRRPKKEYHEGDRHNRHDRYYSYHSYHGKRYGSCQFKNNRRQEYNCKEKYNMFKQKPFNRSERDGNWRHSVASR